MANQPLTIGRYNVLRHLGRGAMGEVYLAYDPIVDRQVAIKTVILGDDAPDLIDRRRRFVQEAQAAGRLQHPNIVGVYDVGMFQGDNMFIAMEYLSGPTLDMFTREPNLLPVERIIALFSDACLTLGYAHAKRVVHRDIKPSNMMLVNGRVKIMDFGIATDGRSHTTQSGLLLGTPNYMSPEQARGADVDGRSDLFSMGIVLYELLTGRRPFEGDSVTSVLYRLIHEEPEPAHNVNPRLSERCDAFLRVALQKNPAFRFQTGQEMATALRRQSCFEASPAETLIIRHADLQDALPELAGAPEATPSEPADQDFAAPAAIAAPVSRPFTGAVDGRHRSSLAVLIGLLFVLAGIVVAQSRDFWARTLPAVRPVLQAGPPARVVAPVANAPEETRADVSDPDGFPLTSDRPGARYYVDGVPVEGDTLDWDPGLAGRVLSASDGCYRGQIELPAEKSGLADLDLRLTEPVVRRVEVRTDPKGATVRLDGKEIEARTPTFVLLGACDAHDVTLSLPGHRERTLALPAEGAWNEFTAAPLRLEPLPDGHLAFEADYPVAIYDAQGRRLGRNGDMLSLPPGTHELAFESSQHRVLVKRAYNVESGARRNIPAPVPGLGTVQVLAYPGNAVIRVDGSDADAPPVVLALGAGEHRIECRWNTGGGKTKEETVLVRAGQTHKVFFRDEEAVDELD